MRDSCHITKNSISLVRATPADLHLLSFSSRAQAWGKELIPVGGQVRQAGMTERGNSVNLLLKSFFIPNITPYGESSPDVGWSMGVPWGNVMEKNTAGMYRRLQA